MTNVLPFTGRIKTQRQQAARRVLIVGTTPLARRVIDTIEGRPDLHWRIVGLLGERAADAGLTYGYPILGAVDMLADIAEDMEADVIVVALTERRAELPTRRLLELRIGTEISIEDGVELVERLTGALALDTLTSSSLVFSSFFKRRRPYLAVTRACAAVSSFLVLIILSPLFALIALAIKIDSAGPICFVQSRAGAMGMRFTLIKFRTMHAAAGRTTQWVRDNGERITRVGRWLRKFRLDELPQLINILRGDMSFVGPRPHPAANIDLLRVLSRNLSNVTGTDLPYYALRGLVRPGITGWAQIRYGYANNFEEELEKLRFDLYYVKHQSLALDLRILAETVRVVVGGNDTGLVSPWRGAGAPARGRGTTATSPAAWMRSHLNAENLGPRRSER